MVGAVYIEELSRRSMSYGFSNDGYGIFGVVDNVFLFDEEGSCFVLCLCFSGGEAVELMTASLQEKAIVKLFKKDIIWDSVLVQIYDCLSYCFDFCDCCVVIFDVS
mmetsp:Transcript_23619/g.31377  ORF Transcript_23619/g.31377 Transcript_23619/m.31377 type:complete len:106 (+) Transcript_23619:517-834(+)